MNPDVVVGERCMRHRSATGRHVAGDAIARGINRAAGRGCRAMAAEALRLIEGACGLGIAVGIVAGHTVELIFALGVATAPRQGGGLKPDRAGVRGGDGAALGAVALPAEPDDRLAVSELGTSNGEVGELGGDGFEMVSARAVASLATDPAVVRQRTGIVPGGPRRGRVAVDALPQLVLAEGFAEPLDRLGRCPASGRWSRPRPGRRHSVTSAARTSALPSSRPTGVRPRSPDPKAYASTAR